jgi:hypothetical protein
VTNLEFSILEYWPLSVVVFGGFFSLDFYPFYVATESVCSLFKDFSLL